ncbi:hypothetical protein V501_00466 [Pseudogymnoascus sp. VKM F-4519 (FW-2642)]|nr:hypothetical protein V501_00466 [Pseudogymnoascus sp. VKM F-4519 (FW-2642)]
MLPILEATLSLALASIVSAGISSIGISRDLDEPDDYSWIKKFAAVGDSFTAGIGSGDLYDETDNSYDCSRYSYTYPVIMDHFFGPSIDKFTYTACSGAISMGIFDQINALDDDQDVVILTAGGNDLCLSKIIDKCIAGAATSDDACDAAIKHAQDALGSGGYFKDNIKDVLTAIDSKMAKNGIVVQVLYAQYFNDKTDACTSEDWQIIDLDAGAGVSLSKKRRTQFNSLVVDTNKAIKEVVEEVAADAKTMTLVTADWDVWAPLTGGQFCEPDASPDPEDDSNNNVMFFKLFTGKTPPLESRSLNTMRYDNDTSSVPEPYLSKMSKRDPVDPGCGSSSLSLPDWIGKIFHPNGLGHEVIAAFALDAIADARAKILGQGPVCPIVDKTTCYSSQGSKAYASAESLNNQIDDFCSYVKNNVPENESGWTRSKKYYEGTLDEYTMIVSLSDNAASFDEGECKDAIGTIINGCDVPSGGDNPMNWKGGGKRVEGEYTYTINIYRTNRPWPPPDKSTQACEGWYKFLFQSYDMYGAGWATYDYGQKSLMKEINPCCGSGSLTGWTFDYFDEPDENGYEFIIAASRRSSGPPQVVALHIPIFYFSSPLTIPYVPSIVDNNLLPNFTSYHLLHVHRRTPPPELIEAITTMAAQQSDNVAHALSGAGGGLLSMALTYPLITLSTRAQVESTRKRTTFLESTRALLARDGPSGLYAGLDSALVGITLTNFVYYYYYEWSRAAFLKARATPRLSTLESMLAGALAGSATVMLTNPIWVINTRMTTRKRANSVGALPGAPEPKAPSTIGTLLALLKEEGPLALFSGVLPALVLVINPILQYTLFEQLRNVVERRRKVTPFIAFLLGALGKLVATSVTYPYITLKSRMHVAGRGGDKEGMGQAMSRIIREEGWAGLYRGIGPKVTQSVLTAAFLFAFKDALYAQTVLLRQKAALKAIAK